VQRSLSQFSDAGIPAGLVPWENRTVAMRSYIAVALVQQDYRRFPTRISSRISSPFNNHASQYAP
jgi:hypothetical protein